MIFFIVFKAQIIVRYEDVVDFYTKIVQKIKAKCKKNSRFN